MCSKLLGGHPRTAVAVLETNITSYNSFFHKKGKFNLKKHTRSCLKEGKCPSALLEIFLFKRCGDFFQLWRIVEEVWSSGTSGLQHQ